MEGRKVVVDNGSFSLKAGWAGQDEPTVVMRTVLGYPDDTIDEGCALSFGEEALKTAPKVVYPIEWSIVTSWDRMGKVWEHLLSEEMKVDTEEVKLLMTEPVRNPKANRQKTVEFCMETLRVPATYLAVTPPLSLYATSYSMTGCVVECGAHMLTVAPVMDGLLMSGNVHRPFDAGGSVLADSLLTLLTERGLSLAQQRTTTHHNTTQPLRESYAIARDIMEKLCHVALDFDHECALYDTTTTTSHNKDYTLPDGRVLSLGKELCVAPECIFRPSLAKMETPNLVERLHMTINPRNFEDSELRKQLWKNIVLVGGVSQMPGLKERLAKELVTWQQNPSNEMDESADAARVHAPANQKFAAWMGGSILAELSTFESQWIQQSEYEEVGPSIVNSKCNL